MGETATAPHRVAVLPLVNIDPEGGHDFFADGLTEELISTLSRIAGLRVIARTSAMRYKGTQKRVAEIGSELDVRTVIEGSVRRSGGRLRVSVQAIDAVTEEHLWARDYDRDLGDVFAIQSDIAQRVARGLRVDIRRRERERIDRAATTVTDAHTLYLEGRFRWNQRSEPALREAVGFFERALVKDPKFALALTGLADTYAALALLEFVPPSEAFPNARRAAEQALVLDPQLAEAHASLGLVLFQYDRDWAAAEREFRASLELNPNNPLAHHYFADYLKAMGRFDEALEQMQRAQELDPLSLAISTGLGHVRYLHRQFDLAIEQYRHALELDPTFVQAHLWFGRPYLQKGMFDEAIGELTQAVTLSHRSTISLAVLAHAYASAGRAADARVILRELLERSHHAYLPSYWIALIYTGLGETSEALRWLDRAFDERSSWLAWIKVEPRFDPLRSEPRFAMLLRRMGLAGPAAAASDAGAPQRIQLREFLASLSEIRTARYRVVGDYARYDEGARNLLKDLRQRVLASVGSTAARGENFLLWAPPGSGKTFFVRELAAAARGGPEYHEINLAERAEEAFRAALATVAASSQPTITLIDEVDSKPTEAWPYEALLPHLDPANRTPVPRVWIVAGSSGGRLADLVERLASRPKGADLLARIPPENRVPIPGLTPHDRLLVATSQLVQAGRDRGHPLNEVEKLALYFVGVDPSLDNARRLRVFLLRAADRVPPEEERLRFDNLFSPGDPQNKEFWVRAREEAPELSGSFLRIEE
ncbi:MAG: tetratricopeptide repeat protein [Thermoplasmata archaeon]|nr:tetratricopeptide repeat protein [Thermoplasmata archaeon]